MKLTLIGTVLVISQLYGLITKTPFLFVEDNIKKKNNGAFKELVKYEIGSKEYNALKTE